MSERCVGAEAPSDRTIGNLRGISAEAGNASKRKLVSRKRDVELVFPKPTEAVDVVTSIVSTVYPPQQVECVQQLNSRKFLVSFKTAQSAECFSNVWAASIRIAGSVPLCKWLGVERKRIKIAFLPNAVPNSELADVLKTYGRVIEISDEVHANLPVPIKTGTRLVDMEMTTAVPNIITVCGFSVPVTYKGVILQCRRCLHTGHLKADCNIPYCDRCKSFGHLSNECEAPCLKCRAPDHHWKDCAVRSYAFAAALGDAAAGEDGSPARLFEPDDLTDPPSKLKPIPVASQPVSTLSAPDQNTNEETVGPHTGNETGLNSGNASTEDNFDSATEHNSETDFEATCTSDVNIGREGGKADDATVDRAVTSTPQAAGTSCDGPWLSAKLRSKKRKNTSITPDKLPEAKKVTVSSNSPALP